MGLNNGPYLGITEISYNQNIMWMKLVCDSQAVLHIASNSCCAFVYLVGKEC